MPSSMGFIYVIQNTPEQILKKMFVANLVAIYIHCEEVSKEHCVRKESTAPCSIWEVDGGEEESS